MGGCFSEKKKSGELVGSAESTESKKKNSEEVEGSAGSPEKTKKNRDALIRDEIFKIFDEYDADKNGRLDKKEVLKMFNSQLLKSKQYGEKNMLTFMKAVDEDGSNSIDKEELLKIYRKHFG
jgi:predicted acetyltransferase